MRHLELNVLLSGGIHLRQLVTAALFQEFTFHLHMQEIVSLVVIGDDGGLVSHLEERVCISHRRVVLGWH